MAGITHCVLAATLPTIPALHNLLVLSTAAATETALAEPMNPWPLEHGHHRGAT
jgi:hypothetical protein